MKKYLTLLEVPARIAAAMMMALVLVFAGCATYEIKDADIQALKKAGIERINVMPLFYKEWGRWTTYIGGGNPEPKPNEHMIKFKERYVSEVFGLMKNKGFLPVEVEKNPGGGVFVEMRIAARKESRLMTPLVAIQLHVSYPLMNLNEEINTSSTGGLKGFMGSASIDDDFFVREIAEETVDALTEKLSKLLDK